MTRTYSYYRKAFEGQRLPLAWLDWEMFEKNRQDVLDRASGLPIRIATKSIRSLPLIKYLLKSDRQFSGVMSFSLWETIWLAKNGIDDILVGYPSLQTKAIEKICGLIAEGCNIRLMIDAEIHLQQIQQIAAKFSVTVSVCLDLDMSSRFPGLHFGVHRSPVSNSDNAVELAKKSRSFPNIQLDSLMGYEAQIAGLGSNVKGQWLKNNVVATLQSISSKQTIQRRIKTVEGLKAEGFELSIVNGGGSGSLESTAGDSSVNELTVGSAFFSPTLFDHYSHFRHFPAMGFAIEAVRFPKENTITAHGGGYVASGSVGVDKQATPYLPKDLKLTSNEGTGEVQTPFYYKGNEEIKIGDPILMRHAKAGELCERFKEIHIVKNGRVDGIVKTYRGEGQCFL